jgi:hypothetical protein
MIGLNATPRTTEVLLDQTSSAPKVVCREILTSDTNGVIKLLTRGFSVARDRDFWIVAFRRMKNHPAPPEYPRYGYFLEADGIPVGVILLIFTLIDTGAAPAHIQCSVSSWYVDPKYRAFGTMLIACALKHKHVTYYNVTPAPHTWEILKAQGYRRFSEGRVVAIPALSLGGWGHSVEAFSGMTPTAGLSDFETQLLRSHAAYGCISIVCTVGGKRIPFVFSVRRRVKVIQFGFLIYCRDLESFVQCSAAIGRYLALQGVPLVILDANKPIPGLFGRFSNRNPKYFKGPNQPRLGDLAYSDRAMFGV